MIYQAGDYNLIFDSGSNTDGDFLQRKGPDGWSNFEVEGRVLRAPIDMYSLPPGQYRLVSPPDQ